MCGRFILVCKMVSLGQIESPTLSHIHCRMIIHQAVNIWLCTQTPKMHVHENDKNRKYFLGSSPFREK